MLLTETYCIFHKNHITQEFSWWTSINANEGDESVNQRLQVASNYYSCMNPHHYVVLKGVQVLVVEKQTVKLSIG